MGAEMHVGEIDPDKHRLASLGLFFDELGGAVSGIVINGFHAFFGQWPGVLDLLRAIRVCPTVDHAPWPKIFLEIGEIAIFGVIRLFRLFFCVKVVKVAIELVKAMRRWQEFILVAQMVFTELPGGIALRLQQLGNRRVFLAQPQIRPRHPDLAQAGAKHALPGDERGTAGGAALLGVVIGERHAFIGNPVDVRGAIAHHAFCIGADIGLADVIAPDDDNIRFLIVCRRLGRLVCRRLNRLVCCLGWLVGGLSQRRGTAQQCRRKGQMERVTRKVLHWHLLSGIRIIRRQSGIAHHKDCNLFNLTVFIWIVSLFNSPV